MEPVSLILASLVAGATAAAKDVGSAALSDAYSFLKSTISDRIHKGGHSTNTLDEFSKDPETWKKPLEKAITASNLHHDPELLEAAQRVLELSDPVKYAQGKYNITTSGPVQGQQVGDGNKQENHFGSTNKD